MKDNFSQDHYVVESTMVVGRSSGRLGTLLRTTLPKVFALFVLCYLVYGRVHIVFTRSESGWLLDSTQSWTHMRELLRTLITHSYSGHYVPLLFLLELFSSVVCGVNEKLWQIHQFACLVLLILALLSFFSWTARALSQDAGTRFWLAAGLTAPLVFSPLMIEFISWPFMVGQLLWAALTVYSMTWVSRAIDRGVDGMVDLRSLGISLACAYISMHALGLGAATMAGWSAVWMMLFLDGWLGRAPRSYLQKLGLLGGTGLLLTALHGALMLLLPRFGAALPSAGIKSGNYLAQTFGYFSCLLWESIRSLWGPNSWPYPQSEFVGKEWVYGLGALLMLVTVALVWFQSQRKNPSTFKLGRLCWHVFSLVAFTAYVFMVSLRVWRQGDSWLGYLIGPRYLWPSALLLFGFFAGFISTLQRRNPRILAALGLLVACTSIAGNLEYQSQVIPKVWPWMAISHEQSWRRIATMTTELQQASLPIPDLDTAKLSIEFKTPLRQFEPLIHSLAAGTRDTPFNWVEKDQLSPELWHAMKLSSPTLAELTKQIFPNEETTMQHSASSSANQVKQESDVSLLSEPLLRSAMLEHIKDTPHLGVDIAVNQTSRKSIWLDSPTSLTYPNLLIKQHMAFHAFVAIHPAVYKERSADGAVFQVDVRVNGQLTRLKELYIDPFAHPELRMWTLLEADLSKYAGKSVDLILSNSPGPQGNDYADWCIWGDPELTETEQSK